MRRLYGVCLFEVRGREVEFLRSAMLESVTTGVCGERDGRLRTINFPGGWDEL